MNRIEFKGHAAAASTAARANMPAGCEPCPVNDARKWGAEQVCAVLAALNCADSFAEVLNVVVAQAMQLLQPVAVAIGRWDPVTQTLGIQAAQGVQSGVAADNVLNLEGEALASAIAARAPVLYTLEGATDNTCEGTTPLPVHTALAVPLCHDCTPFGGMLLYFADRRQISPAEQELVALLSAQVEHAFEIARRVTRAQEAALMSERNRIARELHDSVTHALFAISLIAETLPNTWQSHTEAALQSVAKLHPLAQGALAEMRALLLELRADEGVDRNLGDLLRQLADRTHAYYNLPVTTTIVGDCPLPKQVQAAFYRIAQEALNNTHKHAKANRAFIHLHCQPDRTVTLRISDDGTGMDAGNTSAHGLGLQIMDERAQEIGAALTVASEPGAGTRIVAVWQMA